MARFELYEQRHTTYPKNGRGRDYTKPIHTPYWSIIDTTVEDESSRAANPADYVWDKRYAEAMCAALNKEFGNA